MIAPSEAARFLGCREPFEENLLARIAQCADELERSVHPKFHWQIFDAVTLREAGIAADTSKAALIALTLGAEADALLRRYQKTNMTHAAMLDACATVLTGRVCDEAIAQISRAVQDEGLYVQPRQEPGCGALPLTVQAGILRLLAADKHIGLTANPLGVLLPTKSLTAFVGLSHVPAPCGDGCDACTKTNCAYRR